MVPWGPMSHGLFAADLAAADAHVATEAPHLAGLPALVHDIAKARRVTAGQVGLAWLQQRAEVWGVAVVPIPGTRRVQYLEENVAALDVRLDADELERLDLASRPTPNEA